MFSLNLKYLVLATFSIGSLPDSVIQTKLQAGPCLMHIVSAGAEGTEIEQNRGDDLQGLSQSHMKDDLNQSTKDIHVETEAPESKLNRSFRRKSLDEATLQEITELVTRYSEKVTESRLFSQDLQVRAAATSEQSSEALELTPTILLRKQNKKSSLKQDLMYLKRRIIEKLRVSGADPKKADSTPHRLFQSLPSNFDINSDTLYEEDTPTYERIDGCVTAEPVDADDLRDCLEEVIEYEQSLRAKKNRSKKDWNERSKLCLTPIATPLKRLGGYLEKKRKALIYTDSRKFVKSMHSKSGKSRPSTPASSPPRRSPKSPSKPASKSTSRSPPKSTSRSPAKSTSRSPPKSPSRSSAK